MKKFGDLFTPLPSPGCGIDPRENMLNQVKNMNGERRKVHTQLFMNQLNDTESENINVGDINDQASATGGQGPPNPPLPPVHPPHNPGEVHDPASVNIVNVYNSFNLANVAAPVVPKWKTSETLLDDFHKSPCSCQRSLMDQCVASPVAKLRPICS